MIPFSSIVERQAKWTGCGESDATAGSVFLECSLSPGKRGFLRRAGVFLGAFGLGVQNHRGKTKIEERKEDVDKEET
ncbi:hypothetical protein L596_009059 [Steinernema carpocapsae]|uniref:Uncharacterized protein n=1 Tax=Steinernema carpocapsae TaxID=34508 RepID=A0A4U5PFG8_STECR|nr:hypothetical protein L596_009059 [Steinernema carpocapsae]